MMHNPPITADDIDRVLKGLGSLAQNRPFSADVTRYVGVDGNAVVAILVRSGLVKKTGRAEYSLTPAGRSAVEVALGGTGAPAVPVSHRTFTRPTVTEVVKQLKNLARATGSIDPVEGLDVRLQVSPGGGWKLWYGDPAKDLERGERVPRHEGFWGSSVIRRGYSDDDLNVVARQLIDETEEMYSKPEFQYQKSPFGAARPKRNPHPTAMKIGDLGDANPIEYGGGYIFTVRGGDPWIEWYDGLEADGLEEDDKLPVQIYRVDLHKDGKQFLSWLDWVKWKEVASLTGRSLSDYTASALMAPEERALAAQDVAAYYGWNELDQYPLTLTLGELKDRWEEDDG